MDDLTRRYAKALTAEVEAARCVDECAVWVKAMETSTLATVVNADGKLAQWKAALEAETRLLANIWYKTARDRLADARHAHAKSKARLAVIEDAIRRRRAREYRRDV